MSELVSAADDGDLDVEVTLRGLLDAAAALPAAPAGWMAPADPRTR